MEKLFEAGRIGPLTIKNRAVMPPMQILAGELDGSAGERVIRYYEERAKGGTGLIIVEASCVDDIANTPWDHQLMLTHNKYIAGLQRLAEAVHRYDCHVFIQLHSYGSKSAPTREGVPWTSSEIPAVPGGRPGHAMTVEEIKIVEQRFVDAAVRCKKAGFDGVELAGTHGYLLTQFISPYYNNRTDAYGGSTENRCRIYCEIIRGIHAACGAGFPVSVRFPGSECCPDIPGTLGLADGIEIAGYLEAAGADVLSVSNGNNFNANANCEPYSYRPAWKKHIAKAIKEAVSIPVMATCNIKDPALAEDLLSEGVCDFVCLGRSLIADPYFMKKAAAGRPDLIRKCMGCMYCREQLYAQMPVKCALNPRATCEYIYPEKPEKDGAGRRIAVVGAGPAGLEAAIVMAERGFEVTVFEKEPAVGGSMLLAAKGAYKERVALAVQTLYAQALEAGVRFRLGTAADPDLLAALAPEGLILATGGQPIIPALPGMTDSRVTTAHEIISGRQKITGSACIIGAGMTGLECAEKLGAEGHKITLVEMAPAPGPGMFSVIVADMMSRLGSYQPEIHTGSRLTAVTEKGVLIEDVATGAQTELTADHIILALGVKPDQEGIAALTRGSGLTARAGQILIVGDAARSGAIPQAIGQTYIRALSFLA